LYAKNSAENVVGSEHHRAQKRRKNARSPQGCRDKVVGGLRGCAVAKKCLKGKRKEKRKVLGKKTTKNPHKKGEKGERWHKRKKDRNEMTPV